MKYRRNFEAVGRAADVFFIDGTQSCCLYEVDNEGKITFIKINGKKHRPEEFESLGIAKINFMVPASLEIDLPYMGKVNMKKYDLHGFVIFNTTHYHIALKDEKGKVIVLLNEQFETSCRDEIIPNESFDSEKEYWGWIAPQ